MKPPVIWPFIPPVTGAGGGAGSVNANMYDQSRNFPNRPRAFSNAKRPRSDLSGEQSPFDLTRDYPPLTNPPPLALDIPAVRSLMVEASSKLADIKSIIEHPKASEMNKKMANFNLALFAVIESLVEKVIIPSASNLANGPPGPPTPPKPAAGSGELREAFALADRTAILFDLDMGPAPVGNRQSLSRSLAAGIRAAALSAAGDSETDQIEAVRAAGDALSCAGDVAYLGQASRSFSNPRNQSDPKNGTYCTIPVKLEFEDRQQRIYFEQTMRKINLRASQSLPPFLQKERTAFDAALREKYPESMIMIRPDPDRAVLTAFRKQEKTDRWTQCSDVWSVPPRAVFAGRDDPAYGNLMSPPNITDPSGASGGGSGSGVGSTMEH